MVCNYTTSFLVIILLVLSFVILIEKIEIIETFSSNFLQSQTQKVQKAPAIASSNSVQSLIPNQSTLPIQPSKLESVQIFFDSAESHLSSKSKIELLGFIEYVLEHKYDIKRIRIIGFTDNQGKEEFNYYLAAKRARVVRDFLERGGLVMRLLHMETGGQIDSNNDTIAGRAFNRRTTVMVEWD